MTPRQTSGLTVVSFWSRAYQTEFGLPGNTMLVRYVMGGEDLAVNLMTHAVEEMEILADFLPDLYAAESHEQDKLQAGGATHNNSEDR